MASATVPAIPNLVKLQSLSSITIRVVSPESKAQTQTYLKDIDAALKGLKADVTKMKAPYKAEIDKIEDASKTWKQSLESKRYEAAQALIDYDRKIEAAVAKANAAKLQRFETKVATKTAEAIAEGKPLPLVIPPSLAVAPAKTEKLDDGSTLTKMIVKKWRLKSYSSGIEHLNPFPYTGTPEALTAQDANRCGIPVPPEYFLLDTSKITKVIKAGGEIPGIEAYEETVMSIRQSRSGDGG